MQAQVFMLGIYQLTFVLSVYCRRKWRGQLHGRGMAAHTGDTRVALQHLSPTGKHILLSARFSSIFFFKIITIKQSVLWALKARILTYFCV
jgi:hypothetical protein